jgi:hypothetical protein
VSSGPPNGACIVHHRTDELSVKQHVVSDRQTTFPIEQGAKYTQSLSRISSYLVYVSSRSDVCRESLQDSVMFPVFTIGKVVWVFGCISKSTKE